MPRQPSVVHPSLRLADLTAHPTGEEKLLSIRLPVELVQRLDHACEVLRARKSEVVVAMLNEGLENYEATIGSNRSRASGQTKKKRLQRRARRRR
jgi:predicted DNA-binding protein